MKFPWRSALAHSFFFRARMRVEKINIKLFYYALEEKGGKKVVMEEEEVDVGAREFLKLESRVVVEWNFGLVLVRGKLNLTLQFVQVWLLIGSRNIRLAFNLLSIYLQQIALIASTHKIYSTSLLRVFEFPNSNKHHFILDYAIVPLFSLVCFFSLYRI